MPVNDNPLRAQLVSEVDDDGVSGLSSDGRAREPAVDGHHGSLYTVGCPEHVLHIPSEVSDGRAGQSHLDCQESKQALDWDRELPRPGRAGARTHRFRLPSASSEVEDARQINVETVGCFKEDELMKEKGLPNRKANVNVQ